MIKPNEARRIAEELLEHELPRRWAHTQGVARCARSLADLLGEEAAVVESAAWLHDIGYAGRLVATAFHPVDGARYLRSLPDVPDVLWQLVAHHSGAAVEADERGLPELTDEFARPPAHLLDALTYCDLSTSPDGEPIDVDDRIAEILVRYPADHVVHRSVRRSAPALRTASWSVLEQKLRSASVEIGS